MCNTQTTNAKSTIIVGRATNGSCQLIIQSKIVSKCHARICRYWTTNQYTCEDLNSTNGTTVNGQRINPNEEIIITPDDKIMLADKQLHWLDIKLLLG